MKNIICFIITASILIAVTTLFNFIYWYILCIFSISFFIAYINYGIRKDRDVINELIIIRKKLNKINRLNLSELYAIEDRLMFLYRKHADRNVMMKEEINYYLKLTRNKMK